MLLAVVIIASELVAQQPLGGLATMPTSSASTKIMKVYKLGTNCLQNLMLAFVAPAFNLQDGFRF